MTDIKNLIINVTTNGEEKTVTWSDNIEFMCHNCIAVPGEYKYVSKEKCKCSCHNVIGAIPSAKGGTQ